MRHSSFARRAALGLVLSAVARLRGVPNRTVAVDYERSGRQTTRVTLQRAVVHVPAVPYVVVQRGIAYVPLPGGSGSAGPDVQAAIAHAVSGGARGLVLD